MENDAYGRGLGRHLRAVSGTSRIVRRFSFVSVVLAMAGCTPAMAQRFAYADDVRLVADSAVRTGKLANGLTYYVRRNAWPVKRAEMWLVVNAGSLHEEDDQQGAAHFVEHMAFSGTTHFPKHALIAYLQSVGMGFGADVNASTGYEQTVYRLRVPTDSASVVRQGLRILDDWAHRLSFDSNEVARERAVLIEEWRTRLGVGDRVSRQQNAAIYHGSRFVLRPPIGSVEMIRSVSLARLRQFYRDWYRPDRMAVVIVGDIDAVQMERSVREQFDAIPGATVPQMPPRYRVPLNTDLRFVAITDPELGSSVLSGFVKTPSVPVRTVGDLRARWIASVCMAIVNRLLVARAMSDDPPFVHASVGERGLHATQSAAQLVVRARDGGLIRGLEAVLQELEHARRNGFLAAHVEQEKDRLLRGYEVSLQQTERMPSESLSRSYAAWFVTGAPAVTVRDEADIARVVIPAITGDEIREHLTRFGAEPWTFVTTTPAGAPVPTEAEIRAVLDRLRSTPMAASPPRAEVVAPVPLLAVLPEPGRIVSESRDTAAGTWTWGLSNGLRVVLKPTDFEPGVFALRAFRSGGISTVPEREWIPALTAARILALSGLGANDLHGLLQQTAGHHGVSKRIVGLYDEEVVGAGLVKNAEMVMQCTYLQFTGTRKDTSAFRRFTNDARVALVARPLEASLEFGDTIQATMTQGHPLMRRLGPESVRQLDLDTSYEFIRNRFGNAAGMTFVLVGAFSVDSMRPLVERYVASLPVSVVPPSARDVGVSPPEHVVEKTVYRGREPRSETHLFFHGPFDDSPLNRIQLTLLGEILDRRLTEVLRQRLGATYSPSAGASFSIVPKPWYTFRLAFSGDPARMPELQDAVFAEIRALREHGPTPLELASAKASQRALQESGLQNNAFWMSQIANSIQMGWTLSDMLMRWDDYQNDTTIGAFRMAARRYLNLERYGKFTLYPESMKP